MILIWLLVEMVVQPVIAGTVVLCAIPWGVAMILLPEQSDLPDRLVPKQFVNKLLALA